MSSTNSQIRKSDTSINPASSNSTNSTNSVSSDSTNSVNSVDSSMRSMAIRLNLLLMILEIIATIWMMSGFTLAGTTVTLSASRLRMLKYFTVDSNIFMGVCAGICVVKQRKGEMGHGCYILKLMGTVGVTLTMMVTIFFLVPTSDGPWYSLFSNSNFFFHLLNPALSILIFVCFERTQSIRFLQTLLGTVPMDLYAVFYVVNAAMHRVGDSVPSSCDWYGFLVLGFHSLSFLLPMFFGVTWLMSIVLWKLNRR